MYKRVISFLLACGLLVTMTACGNYSITDSDTSGSTDEMDNPFDAISEDTGGLGAIAHSESNPKRDASQNILPYEYDGGEFAFEYQFTTEGNLGEIGFLLFIDGLPQAYKVDDTNADYEYCHRFPVGGGSEQQFTFLFAPQVGATGDTLNMTVLSITNPGFQPDMKESSSFGWYHKSLGNTVKLHFNADASGAEITPPKTDEFFSDVRVKQDKVTSAFVENELVNYGWDGVSMDTLDGGIYFTTSYNGAIVYDHIDLSDLNELTVRYTLCGTPGAAYRVSLFVDHQPVPYDGVISYEAIISKGNVWSIEATVDKEKVKNFNTFYVVAVPTNDIATLPAQKSSSILLYKEK